MKRPVSLRTISLRTAAAMLLAIMSLSHPASAKTPTVLAFGDSITAGFGLAPEKALPARLQARLQHDGVAARVINGGVSGDTTAGGLARIDWALADKPDVVVLALGGNDVLRGIDPAVVRANLEAMIAKIQASGAKLILLGMRAPPNWGEAYQRDFDRIFPELARAHNLPFSPFFLDGVAMNRDMNQPDGIHPNERGVAVIVDHVAPLLEGVLTPSQAAKPAEGKS